MGYLNNSEEKQLASYGLGKKDLGLPNNEKRKGLSSIGAMAWKVGDEGTDEFMPVKLGGVQLWAPVMRIAGRKTVVETPLVEQNGSVKEIISTDDYVISIRGTIKRKDGKWPDEELLTLLELYQRNEAVPILSAKTAALLNGNEYVVITNINLPDKQGFTESIAYNIECVSDIPFVLELDDKGNEKTI